MSYFAPYIDETGLHMPTYEDRLEDLCSAYRAIFGPEAELSPAVPDYQLLSVLARAISGAAPPETQTARLWPGTPLASAVSPSLMRMRSFCR